ncbi:MAG: YkgJ family cysteine cluster protein [Polyangiaceae bacterium]
MTATDGEPDGVGAFGEAARDAQRAATTELFARLPDGAVAQGAAMIAHHLLEDLLDEVAAHEPEQMKTACADGCAWCCYLGYASISVPEAVAIADHLRDELDEEMQTRIEARLDAAIEGAEGLGPSARWRAREPCPFLDVDRGRCRVYEVRPLRCRGWNSLDANACEQSYRHRDDVIDVPSNRLRFVLGANTEEGQAMAFDDAGRDPRRGEIAQAVRLALDEPELAARWGRGEPVFDRILTDDDLA